MTAQLKAQSSILNLDKPANGATTQSTAATLAAPQPSSLKLHTGDNGTTAQSSDNAAAQASALAVTSGPMKLWHEEACPLHLELAKIDPGMASLIMSMLRLNPQDRVSASVALKHSFLAGACPPLQLPSAPAGGHAGETDQQPEQATQNSVGMQLPSSKAIKMSHAIGLVKHERPMRPQPRREACLGLQGQTSQHQGQLHRPQGNPRTGPAERLNSPLVQIGPVRDPCAPHLGLSPHMQAPLAAGPQLGQVQTQQEMLSPQLGAVVQQQSHEQHRAVPQLQLALQKPDQVRC